MLPVKSQVLDLIEMAFVKDADFKTNMRHILAYAYCKAFWSVFNVLFSQSAKNLTPYLLKEKYTECVVYHFLYKVIQLQSPDNPKSLLGQATARKLAAVSNPALMCDVMREVEWPRVDVEFICQVKPSGMR